MGSDRAIYLWPYDITICLDEASLINSMGIGLNKNKLKMGTYCWNIIQLLLENLWVFIQLYIYHYYPM